MLTVDKFLNLEGTVTYSAQQRGGEREGGRTRPGGKNSSELWPEEYPTTRQGQRPGFRIFQVYE